MKFLIGFATFVVCAAILAFGGYQTVAESDFEKMVEDFEVAIESTPIIPEIPGGNDGNEGGNAGNEGGNAGNGSAKPDNNGGSTDNNGGNTDNNGGSTDNNGGSTDNNGGSTDNNGGSTDNNGGSTDNNGGSTDNNGGNTDNNGGNTDNNGGSTDNNGGNTDNNGGNTGDGGNGNDGDNVSDGGALGVVGGLIDSVADGYNYATSDTNQSVIQNQITQNVDTSTESGQIAADAASSVVENIYKEMDKIEEEGDDKTVEEKAEERQQIVEETKKGLEGAETLISAANGEEVEAEKFEEAISNIAGSSVMVQTGNDIMENDDTKQNLQDAVNSMPEETKENVENTLKEKYEEKLLEDADQAESLKELAGNFGFDINNWILP